MSDIIEVDGETVVVNETDVDIVTIAPGDTVPFLIEDSGTTKVSNAAGINFKTNLTVTDDGDKTVTVDATGVITDTGTDTNGTYIRFDNGIQICWSKVVTMNYASGSVITGTWTFPAAFNAAPAVFHTPTGGISNLANASRDTIGIRTNSIGTSSAALDLVSNNNFSSGDSMDTYGVAYGTWK